MRMVESDVRAVRIAALSSAVAIAALTILDGLVSVGTLTLYGPLGLPGSEASWYPLRRLVDLLASAIVRGGLVGVGLLLVLRWWRPVTEATPFASLVRRAAVGLLVGEALCFVSTTGYRLMTSIATESVFGASFPLQAMFGDVGSISISTGSVALHALIADAPVVLLATVVVLRHRAELRHGASV
jgi:hypothetical protein